MSNFHTSDIYSQGRKFILVDIDETIAFYDPELPRTYDKAMPNRDHINIINEMYDEGHYICMWTARGGSESSKKAGRCYYDFTMKQLKDWGVKFHELSTGSKGNYIKPAADLVLDDKAMTIEQLKVMRKLDGK
tara:strand:- start:534 stop:932 length:399 start_codon:yes stop_codon:yes gene_type:complete